MKVLVTGVGGQLGHDVMNELASRGYEGIVCTDGYHRCSFGRKSPDRGCTGCGGTLCGMDSR